MLRQCSLLVSLVLLIDNIPLPPKSDKRKRGRPKEYSERLILKALLIMIIRRLYTAYSLLAFLEQEDWVAQQLKVLLHEDGKFPTRRTWERRLQQLPDTLPALIGYLGRHLVAVLQAWAQGGYAVAVDSTKLDTAGGKWHKKHRENGEIPHTSIDCEAGWSKSGWHGWWYGWKLHLAVSVGSLWIPLAAELTVANTADKEVAPLLLQEMPKQVRYVLGDTHYNDPELRQACNQRGCQLVATRRGAYPHGDGGVGVRRLFHKLRSQSIEPFNGLFKNVFEWRVKMPVKGLEKTKLLALGAILIYQLVLLYQYEQGKTVGKGIKALLRAA
ncbi:MAG: transposase [Acidobacteriota bacterium]